MKEKGLEEISLGELYEIVRKRRLLILGIIIASLLISAVYAFFLAVPVYKAEALLEVMDIDPGIESQNTAFKAENATNAYIRLLKTPQFINKLASELKAENINIDKAILSKVIAVKEEDDDESITLSAEYKEKAEVAAIVDASVAILCKEASMYAVTQIQREMTAVEERIKLGKAEYEKALTQYDKTSPGTETVSKLQSDLRVNEAILAQLKANLISGNVGYGS
ncbi:MAG TPA: Wzz/FepE/Etk N-terminal domain-containing protein, partial [Candidatus Nitrosocosmicus sp.]|nr:Wzz/FepE/Etk N-terminal domain-containing protein [Candidatus Nitrosocosmicus sp.]